MLIVSIGFAKKDFTLAKIGKKTISLAEFNKRFEQNSRLIPGQSPEKKDVLDNMVYFELAVQEAKKRGLHKDPNLIEQFNLLLYNAVVKKNIQDKVAQQKISKNEIKAYYGANPQLRTKHIIFLSKPGMNASEITALKSKANKALKEAMKSPSQFSKLAQKYSEGPSAKNGGDVDWGARHKFQPEYYNAALSISKVGQVLDKVVETPYGFHIIQLTGKRDSQKGLDSQYTSYITNILKEEKGQSIFKSYFEGLKKSAKVSINYDYLK